MNLQTLFEDFFKDRRCSLVTNDAEAFSWVFQFPPDVHLRAACPWRIITEGGLALGWEDDGQLFGLKRPVDGASVSMDLLRNCSVQEVELAPDSGDLRLHFEGQVRLDLFNSSGGYEGWHANSNQYSIVAQGGGRILVYEGTGRYPIFTNRGNFVAP